MIHVACSGTRALPGLYMFQNRIPLTWPHYETRQTRRRIKKGSDGTLEVYAFLDRNGMRRQQLGNGIVQRHVQSSMYLTNQKGFRIHG